MDKLLSIGCAIVLALCVLFTAWFFSGGFWGDHERSLAKGLALVGGPMGPWGGVGVVVLAGLLVFGLHEVVNYCTGLAFVKAFRGRGKTPQAIAARIDTLPLSDSLKRRLKAAAHSGAS